MQKDISVVIPLYNKEKYIQRTLDSVLNQTFQNFECIIIDSSTDASTDIIRRSADPRIVHIIHGKTRAAHARNLGARQATTDFIAFLDADDEWQPEHLETLLFLKKHFPDAGLFSTPYIKLKPGGSPMIMLFLGIPPPPWEGYLENYLRTCSRGDEPVHSSSCAIPRDIFESAGGFPEDLEYGEDQFLWGKIALDYPVAYSWRGLAIYHTEAMGRICNKEHVVKEHPFSSYLKHELAAGTIPPEKRQECRAYIRRKWYSEYFFTLITGGGTASCSGTTAPVTDSSMGTAGVVIKSNGSKNIIGRILNYFYQSSVHDSVRRCVCRIHGCYNPGQILHSGKMTETTRIEREP